jgi:Asp-tRNA(Asn)/Glu-tRNA(Gln) amidotransferase A subunit family amidase
MSQDYPDASSIAASVRSQDVSARSVVVAALERIAEQNPILNGFTSVIGEQALRIGRSRRATTLVL